MNYIVFGRSNMESVLLNKILPQFSRDETIVVRGDKELDSALSSTRYRPFFNDKWLVRVEMDKLDDSNIMKGLSLLVNDKVVVYLKIDKNRNLFYRLRKNSKIQALPELVMLNLSFPDDEFLKTYIFEKLTKYVDDKALSYLVQNLRYNLDKLDSVIEEINSSHDRYVSLEVVKRIAKPDRSKNVRDLCYCLMFAEREDLAERWKENNMFGHANKKKKPYEIVDELPMDPRFLLNLIVGILQDMGLVKRLYMKGIINKSNVFSEKESLAKRFERLKSLSIPIILRYICIAEETSIREISYSLNEFLQIRHKPEILKEDLILIIYKIMNRRNLLEVSSK